MKTVVTVALAVIYWTRFPVPELSPSRVIAYGRGFDVADDPGLYWIVLHIPLDPAHAVWALSLLAFAVAVAWQPTPLLRFALIAFAPWAIAAGGPYWVPAWAVWMALPASPKVSGAIGVLTTPFRAAAGLPALAWSFRSWRVGLVSLAAFLVVSMLVGGHVFWHAVYIGLGWSDNPWGIVNQDAAGFAATTARYASPEYEAALRGLVFTHVLEQPVWFAGQLAAKFVTALVLTFPWCLAVLVRPKLWVPFLLALAPMVTAFPFWTYAVGAVAVGIYALADGLRGIPTLAIQRPEAREVVQVATGQNVRRPRSQGVISDLRPIE